MNKVGLYTLMLGMLVFGTASTLVLKTMNEQRVNGHDFNHPYLMTATMFLGETFCLAAFYMFNSKSSSSLKDAQTDESNLTQRLYGKIGNNIFAIPAFFDLLASTLTSIGLVLSAASVYQMMRGFLIVVVAMNSVIFLKRRLYNHQILGASLSTIGVVIVGITSIAYQSSSAPNPVLGVLLILAAQLFHGGMFVSEELFFSNVTIDPLEAVGIEGVCGLGYYIILLPILYFIPCEHDFCINGRVEDTILAFEQMADSLLLAVLGVISMVIVALFNWTGISTTKHAGSLARSIIDTSRTLFVWIGSMIIGWERFLWPQLIGFFFLSLGTLIYNEAINMSWLWPNEDISADKEECNSLKYSDVDASTDDKSYSAKA